MTQPRLSYIERRGPRGPRQRVGYRVELSGCWIWTGSTHRGYGRTSQGPAHRAVWEQLVGPIPEGHDLHHRCPNKACVNPAHLTPRARGPHIAAHQRGATHEQALSIRELGAAGATPAAIAEQLGVSYGVVWNVLSGRRYAELGPAVIAERVCEFCGESLTGRRRQARFCCREHQKMSWWRKASMT